ncbi:MAG: glucokinase [Candidatus Anoxymicrobium japonicum]|uniref:Glucokinase n=1 Tax=Candidatus Anoxymicrobium japonicum TaxID=2013648 RepID=A0A2N3G7W5_9ACTN|nr:MAG: glucokinase [Candidatus Anoxymicrobium japonicum]
MVKKRKKESDPFLRCVIGADAGGTKIAVGAVDATGCVILRQETPSPVRDGERMVAKLMDLIKSCVHAARGEGFEAAAVGIAAAGYILHEKGVLLESPNIAWSMAPLKKISREATGLPSFLENDANAAAAGEHFTGACRSVDDFVYLTLGTGVGGGVYIDGNIYRGHRGTAAELGHMVIDPNGPVCGCGRRGCLEILASGTALEREAAELSSGSDNSLLLDMCGGDTSLITGEMVSAAAEKGDPKALEAFKRVAYYLGLGIVNLIHVFNPEMVVLGGGVARSGHLLLDELDLVIAEHGITVLVENTTIVLSTLGGDAGIVGAGAIAWEGIKKGLDCFSDR